MNVTKNLVYTPVPLDLGPSSVPTLRVDPGTCPVPGVPTRHLSRPSPSLSDTLSGPRPLSGSLGSETPTGEEVRRDCVTAREVSVLDSKDLPLVRRVPTCPVLPPP